MKDWKEDLHFQAWLERQMMKMDELADVYGFVDENIIELAWEAFRDSRLMAGAYKKCFHCGELMQMRPGCKEGRRPQATWCSTACRHGAWRSSVVKKKRRLG